MKYFLVVVMLMSAHVTKADIYKCKNEKGAVTFQDSPCSGMKSSEAAIPTKSISYPATSAAEIDNINSQFSRKRIAIEGDAKYETQISACLNLIKENSKEDYNFVVKHIGIIKQNPKSGMQAWKTPPVFLFSNKSAFHSLTWCAGGIAHDAYHSYLFKANKVEGEKYPPYETWAGFSAERKCNKYQISVMRKIGGSESDITYLINQDGTHGDTNKDGKIDASDREGVDW
ncbi:MAG: DUF4124 domain-containing protein [Oleispira sp.]|nr:DUF4124 domain-containing protein [Oleispira sp.]MBL4879897.1 DUF4124 domain-containing protein [Oleispira sp.]